MAGRRPRTVVMFAAAAAWLLGLFAPGVTTASPAFPDGPAFLAPRAALDAPYIGINWPPGASSVQLTWEHVVDTEYYEIYRGTSPYSEIGVAPANQIGDLPAQAYGQGSPVIYDDDGVDRYVDGDPSSTVRVIGDPRTNYFWVVQGRTAGGASSEPSNLVGEFDFAMVSGI